MTWQIPEVFRDQYLAACYRAATNDEAFAKFREDPHISCVIENTPKDWADKALAKMDVRYRKMVRYDYTPTMIRYVYTLSLIEKLIGQSHSVIEIGGGYGGMCEVISDAWSEWDELYEYRIYDLPEVVRLQKRYLKSREVDLPEFIADPPNLSCLPAQLCISWCAWSELSLELRKQYAFNVISNCNRIFLCCNYNLPEDILILKQYFPNLKTYEDELVQGVVYA